MEGGGDECAGREREMTKGKEAKMSVPAARGIGNDEGEGGGDECMCRERERVSIARVGHLGILLGFLLDMGDLKYFQVAHFDIIGDLILSQVANLQ